MYCNGNCEFLDKKRKKCKADGKIIAVMKVKGKLLSYDCYEHIVGCVKDREGKSLWRNLNRVRSVVAKIYVCGE